MNLCIAEKFLLLSLNPEKGRLSNSGENLPYGLIGAILLDLSLTGELLTENGLLKVAKKGIEHSQINASVLNAIESSPKLRKPGYWINKLSRDSKAFMRQFLSMLQEKNLIRIEEKKFLGLITYHKYYLIYTYLRDEILNQLRNCVLYQTELTFEVISLLSLLQACGMHKLISESKEELKIIKSKLKIMMKENPIAVGVNETIQEVQAAISAAVIASTVAATAASSSSN
jgi:golgi phosphoprotein 3